MRQLNVLIRVEDRVTGGFTQRIGRDSDDLLQPGVGDC